ncbi:MAG: Co2+/Mg2+ efflux protein ApaG [Gammaproteobacteria bacterium]|nr:Co2+/Mg2+ efflux protein ApaG [Gammaproteobacteria bacterium]
MSQPPRRIVIEIEVETAYLPEHSDPQVPRYAFSYTITIRNRGAVSATLLTRHWIITDANGKVREVSGDGVIGDQPSIAPGEAHRYSSGTVFETPVGVMEGRYGMITADGLHFPAPIPAFRLAVPGILH